MMKPTDLLQNLKSKSIPELEELLTGIEREERRVLRKTRSARLNFFITYFW